MSRENDCRLLRVLGKKDSDDEEDELFQKYAGGKAGKGRGTTKNQKDKLSGQCKPGLTGAARVEKVDPVLSRTGASKKAKFTNLYSEDGKEKTRTPKLPGRHACECQAREHALINNCVGCGRVVCSQEGSGPCFFCGDLVCTEEEEEIINRGSKKSGELKRQLMAGAVPKYLNEEGILEGDGATTSLKDVGKGLTKALAEKNRLLGYDKDTIRRTKVIDDQADYFRMDEHIWMSKEEKAAAAQIKEQRLAELYTPRSQKSTKVTLDFAGRQVFEEKPEELTLEDQEKVYNELVQRSKRALYTGTDPESLYVSQEGTIACGGIEVTEGSGSFIIPQYISEDSEHPASSEWKPNDLGVEERRRLRLQDHSGMTELAEGGYCLSMHQPYASMLVKGIKKHEGRTWYTAHRGILWIAATARPCNRDESKDLENFYLRYYEDALPAPFPVSYPSGCLLGCVDVLDCVPQEQYLEQYPGGESESPYVLICENPKELPVKMPVRGQHKIYKLDPNVHQAAKKLIGQGLKVEWKK